LRPPAQSRVRRSAYPLSGMVSYRRVRTQLGVHARDVPAELRGVLDKLQIGIGSSLCGRRDGRLHGTSSKRTLHHTFRHDGDLPTHLRLLHRKRADTHRRSVPSTRSTRRSHFTHDANWYRCCDHVVRGAPCVCTTAREQFAHLARLRGRAQTKSLLQQGAHKGFLRTHCSVPLISCTLSMTVIACA
jgi:hypothetical protein